MFYLTNALNTFYLRLYGVRHMVKDHSDSERGNPLRPHRLLFTIMQQGFFYMHHPTDRIIYTTAFVIPVVERWLKREIAQWIHHEGSIRRPIAPWANVLPRSYISLRQMFWRLYGVRYGKRPLSERGNPLPSLLFPISSEVSFICTIPQTW